MRIHFHFHHNHHRHFIIIISTTSAPKPSWRPRRRAVCGTPLSCGLKLEDVRRPCDCPWQWEQTAAALLSLRTRRQAEPCLAPDCLGRLWRAADRARGSLQVARWLSEEVQLVPMFNEFLPLAQHTCSFAPTLFRNAREGVALGARPRELLKVGKILNNDSLLLASNGQIAPSGRALSCGTRSRWSGLAFVGSKVCVVHESDR